MMTPYAQMLLAYVRPEAQGVYAYEYERYAKDAIVAQTLAIFLGIVGGEGYYLGDWKRGIWMTIALFSGVGLFISVPVWIARCFTIVGECEAYNDYLAWCLAYRYLPAGTAPQPPQPAAAANGKRGPIGGLPMRVSPRA
ncbi:MAG TPA: hypothetical protein VMG98_13830 [Verrucomicrobiae bacterium]|nr:hypothetical protein [Verrucomicrobiae bacterium]